MITRTTTKKRMTIVAGKDVGKEEHTFTAGDSINCIGSKFKK